MEHIVQYDLTHIRGSLADAFILLINAIFFKVVMIGPIDIYPVDRATDLINEQLPDFDFIVVGGGAAGCSLAMLLTNVSSWNVLLLEAGGYPPPSSEVPGFYKSLKFTGQEQWNFQMESDENACQAMEERRCTVIRGRVIGGTSTLGNLHYIRGFADDFDKTSIAYWNSNITGRLFQHLEEFSAANISHQFEYGKTGPMILTLTNITHPIKDILKRFYKKIGQLVIPRRKYLGFTDHLVFARNSERYNMAKNFLTPVKDRPNLFVSYNSLVRGIVIAPNFKKQVSGVNVTVQNLEFMVKVKKEVILTAGAINNAKLLMVSGIGHKDYLRTKRIQVVSHLPQVGKNLQFHLSLPMFFSLDECFERQSVCQNVFNVEHLVQDTFHYIMNRTGSLSSIGVHEFALYINTGRLGITIPNVGIFHKYYRIRDREFEVELKGLKYRPQVMKSLLNHNDKKAILEVNVVLLTPMSKGEVLLNDTHILGNPKINPNFMSDEDGFDYDSIMSGFKYLTNITRHGYAKDRDLKFLDVDVPDCRNYKFCSMFYVKCYIANMIYPLSDVSGSTRMGHRTDDDAVLTQYLKVKGVRGLRVGDVSIMPFMVSGNTLGTDAMIGYRVGEIIREKYLEGYKSEFSYNETEFAELMDAKT